MPLAIVVHRLGGTAGSNSKGPYFLYWKGYIGL